jgi:hypothetical protein
MEFLLYLVGVVLVVIPFWKILEREGINPMWSLVSIVPLGVMALLWYLAFWRGASKGA